MSISPLVLSSRGGLQFAVEAFPVSGTEFGFISFIAEPVVPAGQLIERSLTQFGLILMLHCSEDLHAGYEYLVVKPVLIFTMCLRNVWQNSTAWFKNIVFLKM